MSKHIYLDYAAATPLDPKIAEAMAIVEREHYANPVSEHEQGRAAGRVLEDARKRVAVQLGAKPREIVFTSGSTEAANMAILGVLRKHPSAKAVSSAIEHEAVLEPLAAWGRAGGLVAIIPVDPSGVVNLSSVVNAIDDQTVLVCVMLVNNELGTIQPISKIAAEITKIRLDRAKRRVKLPLQLYCDAAQAGLATLKVSQLGVDMMSLGGSKLYGPRGMGCLYVRTGVKLEPIVYGGGHEAGHRSGTPHVAGALGFAMALEGMQKNRHEELARLAQMRGLVIEKLSRAVDGVRFQGSGHNNVPSIISLTIEGIKGQDLVAHLGAAGIAVATGSACTASEDQPSHVLRAIGLTSAQATSSLRISLGRHTSVAELENFIPVLARAIKRLRGMASGAHGR